MEMYNDVMFVEDNIITLDSVVKCDLEPLDLWF